MISRFGANSSSNSDKLKVASKSASVYVASRAKGYATRPWEIGSNFHQAVFRGTSASAAQVSGVCALHLQTNPNLTPQELKERVVQDGKSVMVDDTGTTTELGLLELAGANNKFLFNRYNKVSLKTEGTFTGPVKGLTVETS